VHGPGREGVAAYHMPTGRKLPERLLPSCQEGALPPAASIMSRCSLPSEFGPKLRKHADRRVRSVTEAAQGKAPAEASVASGSFQSRLLRLIQAKNPSTTQRRGQAANPT
jgi:hypothetical protein